MNPKHITYIYLAILLLGTLLPINGSDSALNNNYTLSIRWDYLLHALVYLPLPALTLATVRGVLKNGWMILLIGLVIAAGLEALQMFVPYRAFNINDLVANGVGVTLGWIIITVFGTRLMAISKTKHKYREI